MVGGNWKSYDFSVYESWIHHFNSRVMNFVQFGLRQKFVEMSKMDMRKWQLARKLAGKKASWDTPSL